MKKKLFVVEGKNDIKVLKKIDKDILVVKVNGLGINQKTIDHLKNLEELYDIYLLLDPDSPGYTIRRILHLHLKNPIDIFVPKKISIKNNKVGIENVDPKELEKCLNYTYDKNLSKSKDNINKITLYDLYKLNLTGPNSFKNRVKLAYALRLFEMNSKKLLEYLNSLNLDYNKIKEILDA